MLPSAGGRPAIGPILVVCFTNHALDSFLVDILDSKVCRGICGLNLNGGRSSRRGMMSWC